MGSSRLDLLPLQLRRRIFAPRIARQLKGGASVATRLRRIVVLLLLGLLFVASQADAQRRERGNRNRRQGGARKVSAALFEFHRQQVASQVRRVLDSATLSTEQAFWVALGLDEFLQGENRPGRQSDVATGWTGTPQDLRLSSSVGNLFPQPSASVTPNAQPLIAIGRLTCLYADQLLLNGRFIVSATYQHSVTGQIGTAFTCPLTPASGYFFFGLDATNVEVPIKMLNACLQATPRWWVFAAGLTDFGVQMTVFDVATGISRTYSNPPGSFFDLIIDQSPPFPC